MPDWSVVCEKQPDRTSCIHCGHTRKFKRFQHCHTTDESEEARIAVAEVRAKINDQMDLFEETYEAGVLHDDPDSFFDTESEAGAYFDEKVEQLHSNNGASSRSNKTSSGTESEPKTIRHGKRLCRMHRNTAWILRKRSMY